jgi:hypothetical protein
MTLHCPARLVLVRSPERFDRQQVAKVYARSAEDASALAVRLGVPPGVVPELADDLSAALEEIADQHRGETVVVLADPAVLGLASDPAEIEHDGTAWWQP